ncbi:hypothetical protein GGF32_003642 [Allomyces javanicus]|nr:hypothetical protein GGF32_003642 [Allomyces javanicus]
MIGPDLPPHLAARRRQRQQHHQPQQQQSQDQPSSAGPASANADADADRAPGPASAPAPASASTTSESAAAPIGPSLPPHLLAARNRKRARAETEESDDSQPRPGPAPPARVSPVAGPAPWPIVESDDDDDVVGPRPPSPTLLALQQDPAFLAAMQQREAADRLAAAERDRAQAAADAAAAASAEPQRGEWMLVPPTALAPGLAANPMRSRTFAKREADYNATTRPKTLLAEYESGSASETKKRRVAADKDGERRPFDRERDVLGHRPVDAGKRQEMVENAKDLGSKFAHGSRAFL